MNGSRDCHTEVSQTKIIIYMWNLKKCCKWTDYKIEIRVTDVENCGYQGGKGRGINWEIGTEIYTLLLLLLLLHRFSRVRLCATPGTAARQAPHPWGSPGKNTGVGCQFLLQCMKVKRESEVTQLCLIRSNPVDCSLPASSIHGIFQARVLEWGAIAFSHIHTTIYEIDKNLLYSTWKSTQYCVMTYMGKESKKEWIYV